MITSLIETTQLKVAELKGIGKKYPVMKTLRRDINAEFEDFWALKGISLEACQGEVWGVIGRNGAGKTTLLNIITGVLSPTEGEVFVKGKVLGLFNLGVGFQDELSGRENIFLNGAIIGAKREELTNKLNSIIEFSELGDFIDMPLGAYSQGMRLRLAFSIITSLEFDILVMDEVLAVGDALFQSKCFERLMDFRRSGKTLVITSQSMDLIERLCDKAALLDHGKLLFCGDTKESINRYRMLLNTEKFFVGPQQRKEDITLVKDTKKWTDDISQWGKKFGTKEAVIDSVRFLNKFGFGVNQINSGQPLKIRVNFTAKNKLKQPHFGIAIFREDGVYCYGPNTHFDGHRIPEIEPGKSWFYLDYKRILLAPGEYRVSVAIWDENETLAFDYHPGCYKLMVKGRQKVKAEKELLNIPFKFKTKNFIEERPAESIKLLDARNREKTIFFTNEPVKLVISNPNPVHRVGGHEIIPPRRWTGLGRKAGLIWVGFFRDDGIFCQGIIGALNNEEGAEIFFPHLPLLPGTYKISIGASSVIHSFQMVFNCKDYGTVYLEHKWKWKIN